MSYKEKPILKLYKYENNTFVLQAIIDDFMECSFERNLYQAGNFTISINYNIPNAQLFQRGLFVQFGNDPYDFGEIISISDAISSDGKGSQVRTITGYDSRYILKRRVIKNMNSNGLWVMTGKGEIVLRNLINDQCGAGESEIKRQLPIINSIPDPANAIGKEYSVSEQFSNLYEVCKTIATQSEIGWRLKFDNSSLTLTLECYEGENRAQTVQFSTSFDSLANGQFTDSSDSYTNAIYVGGKGQNDDRDIYEGEDGTPAGLDRYESWDNQSNMTTESEYEAEALSILTQYGQTITVSGNGLAKSPYVYKEEYNVGDIITLAFSGKSAVVQILNVTEHWSWGNYNISFSFGKPQNNLADQLQLILRKIQTASEKSESTDSVRWYTIPDDSQMPKADVTYRTIGFIGNVGSGAIFQLYLDNEKTGAKTYHIYFKQLAGAGKLTLTTGKEGASNLVLNAGTYVAIVYVDENGNITSQGMTATSAVEAGNNQPVTSDGVNSAISGAVSGLVTGVKGNNEVDYRTGNVNITKANIGLGNVDNTSDADKPVSTAQATAISNAINALDVASVGGSGKYLSAISETNGKISATAGNISGTVTSGDSAPVSGGAVADILSSLPTDAVLHYSFDEVPDYPDGTADVRLLNDNTYDIQETNARFRQFKNLTVSNSNGNAVLTASADSSSASGAFINGSYVSNKIIKMKIKVTALSGTLNISNGKGTNGQVIATYTTLGIYEFNLIINTSAQYPSLYITTSGANESFTAEVLAIYIGDGSYNTPIIDNANGKWNSVSQSGVAIQGVSGKGMNFLNNNYIAGDLPFAPYYQKTFTFSCWIKKWDRETNIRLFNDWEQYSYSPINVTLYGAQSATDYQIYFDAPDITEGSANYFYRVMYKYNFDSIVENLHIVVIFNQQNSELFINGEKVAKFNTNRTYGIPENKLSSKYFQVGRFKLSDSYEYSNASIDDLLIFDRALTEKEVLALYYNKANTPKYYSFADYRLDNM